jgi:hypothetical protein
LVLGSFLFTSPALAGPIFSFDEDGHGILGPGTPNAILVPGFISAVGVMDSSGHPVTVQALTYDLARALGVVPMAGDVAIFEPGNTNGPSDLVRFGSTGLLYVFSTITIGEPRSLADVTTTPLTTHAVFLKEITLSNGGDGVIYTPGVEATGVPEAGSIQGGITYEFTSNSAPAVPEPAAITLFAIGLLSMAGYAKSAFSCAIRSGTAMERLRATNGTRTGL